MPRYSGISFSEQTTTLPAGGCILHFSNDQLPLFTAPLANAH
jgi:hypothetical protein